MNIDGKILIFVSTGRCGTVRLTEILKKNLSDQFSVAHQLQISRLANIIGNILFYFNNNNSFKAKLYNKVLKHKKTDYFISTDPLTSMIIPKELICSEDVAIIHIYRDLNDFATSFYKFSRKKPFSFIAHNFIPFWQIKILPLQNLLLGKKITNKYKKTANIKNEWFVENYKKNKYFLSINMKDVFNTNTIEKTINEFFGTSETIVTQDFKIKSNTSK